MLRNLFIALKRKLEDFRFRYVQGRVLAELREKNKRVLTDGAVVYLLKTDGDAEVSLDEVAGMIAGILLDKDETAVVEDGPERYVLNRADRIDSLMCSLRVKQAG